MTNQKEVKPSSYSGMYAPLSKALEDVNNLLVDEETPFDINFSILSDEELEKKQEQEFEEEQYLEYLEELGNTYFLNNED